MNMASREQDVRPLAEASAWRVALSEADAETSEDFEAWLAGDPRNEQAWDEVQASWGHVGDQANSPELLAMRRNALDNARRHSRRRWVSAEWLPRIAAALLLAVVLGSGLLYLRWNAAQPLVYATATGERRVLTLEDGSKVSLDVNSEVQIRYSGDARRLELIRGQARFDVAKDVLRPFSVRARDRLVVATGTAFNVDLLGRKVLVTLIEGKVLVMRTAPAEETGSYEPARPAARETAIPLAAGQQFVAEAAAPPEVEAVSVDRATAWEQGQLVFEDETLAEIAERVSRYSKQPVTVAPGAAQMRVSGVFVAGDVSTFVDTVSRYLPVRAKRAEDGSVVLDRTG